MSINSQNIVFVDNSVNRIFKTIEVLKHVFPNLIVFNQEKDLIEYLEKNPVDVVFMNLDLQPNDAVTILKEIKHLHPSQIPFMVIYTEKSDDFIQELAFNSGADSFINFHNKPAVIELFLKNLLRRREVTVKKTRRDFVVDAERFLVYKSGEPFQLPRKEFRLFELLYNSPEKFFTKHEIAQQVWHDESVAGKRIIDVHIYNIRQYLGKRIIQSQKGKGYRINKKLIA